MKKRRLLYQPLLNKSFFILYFLFFVSISTFGQNFQINDVLHFSLRSAGEMLSENGEVKGYYFFYKGDRAGKGNYNFTIEVLDENLKKVNSIEIVKNKETGLLDAAYNGSNFAFLFFDVNTRDLDLITYDKQLRQTGRLTQRIKIGYNTNYFWRLSEGVGPFPKFIVPIKNKGFLFYTIADSFYFRYSIDFFDNSLNKIWNNSADLSFGNKQIAAPAFQTKKSVASLVADAGDMFSDSRVKIILKDMATGQAMLDQELKNDKYKLSISKAMMDETTEDIFIFGEYFPLKYNLLHSYSLGYFVQVLRRSGMNETKFFSWENDISKFIPANKFGKMENGIRIYMHDIIRNDDGDLFLIGEQFRKKGLDLEILDLVIFKFNADLSLQSVNVIDKSKNVHSEISTAESPLALANTAASAGCFDYRFFQMGKDKKSFVITCVNKETSKDGISKKNLINISYTSENDFVTNKSVINANSSNLFIFKGKEGYIMITEYLIKEKKLDTRLEKVNY